MCPVAGSLYDFSQAPAKKKARRRREYTDATFAGAMVVTDFPLDSYPLVVAHRGASADHPENTLQSFQGALDAGAQVIETDVRLTADGVPIVLHDADVSRCTDGSGFVNDLTIEEVKRLDASGGRAERAEVPTLAEVLELVSGRAGINLEIKNIPGEPSFD